MSRIIKSILTTAVALFFMMNGLVVRAEVIANDIKLTDNGVTTYHVTSANAVGEFLKEQNISIKLMDILNYDTEDKIVRGMNIEITRGFYIYLMIDDRIERTKVSVGTLVGHLKSRMEKERNIEYTYVGSLVKELRDGDELFFTTDKLDEEIKTELVEETGVIPFITEITESEDLPTGVVEVAREGSPGTVLRTYSVRILDGQEERSLISEEVMVQPVSKVVMQGAAGRIAKVIHDGAEIEIAYESQYIMNASAYNVDGLSKKPGSRGYGKTASGTDVRKGVVAVDPRVIPLGSKLYVEGYGYAVAEDTGGSIIGNEIDLYFETLAGARQFGRKDLTVYLLD